jgi:NADPH:quinone reductase-like Zn-dependent oxidoreductase
VQLAALAHSRVIATASSSSHDLVKSLGAEAVFDYKDPSVVDKIRAHAGGALELAADCVSQQDTAKLVGESLSSEKGGRVAVILPVKGGEENGMRKDVEYGFTTVYQLIGQVSDFFFPGISHLTVFFSP